MIPAGPDPIDLHVDESSPLSKTRRKHQMLELQTLGEALTALSEEQLAQLELPERLLDAVLQAKSIHKFGALRRQLQYIGRLMREVDSDAIAARLDAWKGVSREATARLHLLERWRDRLLDDDGAVSELATSYPGCDTQRLRTLIRNARQERDAGRPPRNFRALFQELRTIIPESADDEASA
jgi:ribosome-associated protein